MIITFHFSTAIPLNSRNKCIPYTRFFYFYVHTLIYETRTQSNTYPDNIAIYAIIEASTSLDHKYHQKVKLLSLLLLSG